MRRSTRGHGPLAVALAAAATLATPALAAAAPSIQITDAGASVSGLSSADEVASLLLGPGLSLAGPATIDGGAAPDSYAAALPSFGRFTNGGADIGIDDGLIVAANARASSFATAASEERIAPDRADDDLFGVVDAAGLCAGPAAVCTRNATSVEFAVRPTARYLKFEYALVSTESGSWSGASWTGNVLAFPDGIALFVGGRRVADDCAVVPRTSEYLTMQTAGIVAPAATGDNRARAQANLDARVANPAAPAGFAYATQDPDWTVQFATVPLTCVADVDAAYRAGTPTEVKIVIADVNDSYVSPAVFLKAGSVRFSTTDTPSTAPDPPAPPSPPAPAPPAPPAPPVALAAPAAPAAKVVTPLAPPVLRRIPARAGGGRRVVQRLRLDGVGRYTFLYVDRASGRRLTLQPGSAIGRRALTRRSTAPVVRNARPGARIVLSSRLLARGFPRDASRVALRVILRSPDGTLSQATIGADGRVG